MDPIIWGPSAWNFIHFLTIAYPDNPSDEDKNNHKNFIRLLPKILPCNICRTHFSKNIENVNLNNVVSSKKNYMHFMWNIHNKVNTINKNPTITFTEFLSLYKNIIDGGSFNPIILYKKVNIYYYSLLVVFIIITLLILYYIITFKKI